MISRSVSKYTCSLLSRPTSSSILCIEAMWGDWKCGSGKCDMSKIDGVENAGADRMAYMTTNDKTAIYLLR